MKNNIVVVIITFTTLHHGFEPFPKLFFSSANKMDENKFLREKGFKYILEEQPCS
jgi:hypothetical protein